MAASSKPQKSELFRVREAFGVPGADGFMRAYAAGALVDGGDPIATSHRALLEPASSTVEQATAAPGERRVLGLRLPSRTTQEQAIAHQTGQAHEAAAANVRMPTNVTTTTDPEGEPAVPHALPPEHPDSPASVHAPLQPGLGVVADDADERGQNQAGGPKSSESKAAVKKAARASAKQAGEGTGEIGTPVAQGGDATGEGETKTVEPDKQAGTSGSSS